MRPRAFVVFSLFQLLFGPFWASSADFHAPPGHYATSWVGNTFAGDGGPNGFGYWVQNGADEIEVAADGTVIAANGDIWHGDAPGKTIRRHAFRGWNDDGTPRFEAEHPASWPWPEDFANVRRVNYAAATDSVYLSGYLQGEAIDSWGVVAI